MDDYLSAFCRFFAAAAARTEPLAMATVVATEGSTYAKAGARILIAADGSASGILSGGCLEADLCERARGVIERGRPERVRFDSRTSDDPVLGLGLGCEGAMDVWLEPARAPDYASIAYLNDCHARDARGALATVVGGEARGAELGRHAHAGGAPVDPLAAALANLAAPAAAGGPAPRAELRHLAFDGRTLEVFVAPVGLATSLLLCGAGRDAIPVHTFAAELGWRVTVYDHRPAYATAAAFPRATRVLCARPEEARVRLAGARFDAAVVMSHRLDADAEYLRFLAACAPRFIGLLGPAARRARLFEEIGAAIAPVAGRIRGPVGLDIGAASPEGIALAIVAEVQAVLAGRAGGSFASPPPRGGGGARTS